ncbi:MAG: hypothetical protein P4L53_19950 [Candidatus Obscuribacterales bacterium]|nr:hypothetical protein [Candidatus Obscuribacterales bacterium]
MEKQCQDCQQICKKLADGEQPSSYYYSYLSPAQVIAICDKGIKEHNGFWLNTEDSAVSFGNQLAVMMDAVGSVKNSSYPEVVFIIQAEVDESTRTKMWIRYGTPSVLCAATPIVTELTILIQRLLRSLGEAERVEHDKYHF